jgi:hypothetical protein
LKTRISRREGQNLAGMDKIVAGKIKNLKIE